MLTDVVIHNITHYSSTILQFSIHLIIFKIKNNMTDIDNNTNDQDTYHEELDNLDKGLFNTLNSLLKNITMFAASLGGFTVIAYIFGWNYCKTYYHVYNADWIMTTLTSREILTSSFNSIVGIIFCTYLGIILLMEKPERRKHLYPILKYGFYIIASVLISSSVLSFWEFKFIETIQRVLIIPYQVLAAAAILTIAFPPFSETKPKITYVPIFYL